MRGRPKKNGRETNPVRSAMWRAAAKSSAGRLLSPASDRVHQPRCRNDEQRGEDEPEQRVQPDQGDVEQTEADADPKDAQRTV